MSNFDRAVKALDDVDEAIDHLADNEAYVTALEAAGLLAPDLPEPDSVKLNGDVKYFTCYGVQVRQDADDGHVQIYSKRLLTTNESRRLALALLAAADYAEKEQDNERHYSRR